MISLVTVYQTIILNNTYKLLSEKSFQTLLTNYYQITNCKLCLQEFIREFNSFQRILPIYSTFITDNSLKTMIRKFTTNNALRSCNT